MARMGWGRRWNDPTARAGSRGQGYDVTNFLCTFYGDERIVGGKALSAGHDQKAGD
jgi:hypothetical protein